MFKSNNKCCCVLGHNVSFSIKNKEEFLQGFLSSSPFLDDNLHIPFLQLEGVCVRCDCVVKKQSAITDHSWSIVRDLMIIVRDLRADIESRSKSKK